MSRHFEPEAHFEPAERDEDATHGIAIIGMAGRFPQAPDLASFWRLIDEGREGISRFDHDTLRREGLGEDLLEDPRYVPARGVLDGVELFDSAFFGMAPREAEITDPQQRILLECAWQALEDGGVDPATEQRAIGVYVGVGANTYAWHHLGPEVMASLGEFEVMLANDKDYAATQISYRLDLRGPSLAIQTACSTSLVAIHQACLALDHFDCDLALAGGASIRLPQHSGYLYREGGILSAEGRCRPFDAAADGTVSGNGAGLVLLERLDEALAKGHRIVAVIRGSAVNNDGAAKVGYTAPSERGQAEVIATAQEIAGVEPASIGYIETHGTGTPLGDPIELAALRAVFGDQEPGTCALGAVKSTLGHLDAAAGVTGLIKASLALDHRRIPGNPYFESPNPRLGLDASPFYLERESIDWPAGTTPRRAGVSSFGIGGTNAHMVLEEAPPRTDGPRPARRQQLWLLSARTATALDAVGDALQRHLETHPELDLADAAHTLRTGRKAFEHRRILVADSRQAVLDAFTEPGRLATAHHDGGPRPVAFLFPGQGAQHPAMVRDLAAEEPLFRDGIERGLTHLRHAEGGAFEPLARRLEALIGPGTALDDTALAGTDLAQPALFLVEHALAELLEGWGLEPVALLGHSLGELVAACRAGVFSFEDALLLVAERGRLMATLPGGAMLSVERPAAELERLLGRELALAAINAPELCTVSGPVEAIESLATTLAEQGIESRRLRTSHAFHSAAMDPILDLWTERVATARPRAPERSWISNRTGTWITEQQATDPRYWAEHLRHTVRFADGLATLRQRFPGAALIEVGPGRALSTLARRHPDNGGAPVFQALPAARNAASTPAFVQRLLGRLWLVGAEPDWRALVAGETRRTVALPTYPFERRRAWVERRDRRLGAAPLPDGAGVTAAPAEEPAAVLPAASHDRPALDTPYIAPCDPDQERLAAIWGELLGLATVGVNDNFFELGGHSLLASRVVARCAEACGVDLPLAALFATPTVAELAAEIARRGAEDDAATLPTLVPDPSNRHQPFPLNELQQAYWVGRGGDFEMGNVANHIYLEVEGRDLDLDRLEAAWQRLVRRHDMLRAIVRAEGRQQILAEVDDPTLDRLDLRQSTAEVVERQLVELRHRLSHQNLAGDRWPLFEIVAALLDNDRVRLHISIDGLLVDGWSFGILFRELQTLYFGGLDQSLPPLELSFRDYVLAERELVSSPLYQRELERWRGRLAELPGAPQLPLARRPESLENPRFRRLHRSLDPARWQWLKERSAQAGVSTTAVLATAYARVLARWSAQPHFVLNVPRFNRLPLHPQVEAVVGQFASFTLLEVDFRQPASLAEQCRQLQQSLWRDLDRGLVSGVTLLRELGRLRGGLAEAAMPVVFTSAPGSEDGGLRGAMLPSLDRLGEVVYSLSQTPQVWLDQQIGERGGALEVSWDAVDALFPEGLLDEMFEAYGVLLERLADDDAPWRAEQIELLSEPRLAWLDAQAGEAEPIPELLAHQLFSRRAAEHPERTALITSRRQLSYGTLATWVHRLGHGLRTMGARPDTLVAVVMEKGWEQVLAVHAVLASGAAYLPLDAELPRRRLHHLLERGEVAIVLTQPHLAKALDWPAGLEILAIGDPTGGPPADDPFAGRFRDQPTTAPEPIQDTEALAYVLFTSGSTGEPKGVMIAHRGLVNALKATRRRFDIGPDDRALALTALHHDMSVFDCFGVLGAGATLVIPDAAGRRDPGHWAEQMARHRVTLWNSVPAMMEMLLEYTSGRPDSLGDMLRLAFLGGDWIAVDLPERLAAQVPGAGVVSVGGPTETTLWNIWHPVESVDPAWPSIPYGRAIANTRYRVMGPGLEERGPWVPGELCVSGVGVAKGYWRDPERTAASFVSHPGTGERLYRCGDLGRFHPDGTLEFLGREDFQVKIHGQRIELGEIESELGRHPAIRRALVTAPGEGSARRLVAYLLPEDEAGPEAEGLARFATERLPRHMVPAHFVWLEAFPLTANGKVDRRALPVPGGGVSAPAHGSAEDDGAPRGALEERLATLWAELLDGSDIGRGDNFFELGGNSLQAVQMATRVREDLGLELPLRRFFEQPTLAGLARILGELAGEGGGRHLPAIVPVPRGEHPELSYAQQRLWLMEQLSPDGALYNDASAVRLVGPLDARAMARALSGVVRRHEVLRTTFPDRDGKPYQAITPASELELPRIELGSLPPTRREPTARALARRQNRRPFDLAAGPLLRPLLVRLEASTHLLFLFSHHIVSDAWSRGVLVREVEALYGAERRGEPSPLPELAVQYADYAVWQRRVLDGGLGDELLDYWRRRLAGAPPALELPTDHPRPPRQSYRGAQRPVRIEARLAERLGELARGHETTLFATLLAAWQVLLGRLTGQHDVVVGTDVANRNRRELEPLIGFFVNVVPLRTDLSSRPTFAELLGRVRETTLGAFAHEDMPFDRLVEALRPERRLDRMPLVQTLFLFDNTPFPGQEIDGLVFEPFEVPVEVSRFDLAVFLSLQENGDITGTCVYGRDLFEPPTIDQLLERFRHLLADAVARPATPIDALRLREPRARDSKEKSAMKKAKGMASKFDQFMKVKPKTAKRQDLVSTAFLPGAEGFPLVIEPRVDDVDLAAWAREHRDFVDRKLRRHGALLFRGFGLSEVSQFENVANALCPELYGDYGDLPDEEQGEKIYQSTPYPADKMILFHNESSHMDTWPLKQFFFSLEVAEEGGQTPLVDCRRLLATLSPTTRQLFADKKLMYVRNFLQGLDVDWRDFFHTDDRAEVEANCRRAGMDCHWNGDNLRVRKVAPAVTRHPKTGEEVFFNQIQLHHISCLDHATRRSLIDLYGEQDLPRNVLWGDGTPIDDAIVAEVGEALEACAVEFPWRVGDLVMVDNMLTAHARRPFRGQRKIAVAMGEMVRGAEVEQAALTAAGVTA